MANKSGKASKPVKAEGELIHCQEIPNLRFVDDAGNQYYLDETRNGAYLLRMWKRTAPSSPGKDTGQTQDEA